MFEISYNKKTERAVHNFCANEEQFHNLVKLCLKEAGLTNPFLTKHTELDAQGWKFRFAMKGAITKQQMDKLFGAVQNHRLEVKA